MLQRLKKSLGYIRRGVRGIWDNHFEPLPPIPESIHNFSLGSSIEGRPISCYSLGNGSQKILIVAGIHGNETGAIKLGRRIIEWLRSEPANLSAFTFYIIPCLNPDGFAQAQKNPDYWQGGLIGRFNGNGVDLNRNFDTPNFTSKSVWSRGKNYSENSEVYCGPHALSESETQGLVNFIRRENIKIYIALHNAGADVMGSNNELGEQLAKIFARSSGYKLVSHEDWAVLEQTGTAKEWCDRNGITYLEIEGRYRWSSDWVVNQEGLKAVFQSLNLKK